MKRHLLIDGNAIGFAAAGSERLSVGDQDTHAIFGMLRTMRVLLERFPTAQPLVLWDGRGWRKSIYPEYKANRDKTEPATATERKAKAMRDSYKSQRPHIKRALGMLGLPQLVADNMEADDLAAMMGDKLTGRGDRVIFVTGDKDWLQLIGSQSVWFDPIHDRRCVLSEFEQFTGYKSPRQFLEGKALQGDVSDNIGGVGGIGDKGAKALIDTYGSVAGFLNACMDGSVDVQKLPKKFRDFADETQPGRSIFARNMRLMDLRSVERPKPQQLVMDRAAPDIRAFRGLCEEFLFRSILDDFDRWIMPFLPNADLAAA